MIYAHYSEVQWDRQRWPNFRPSEFACPHCGEFWWDERVFDAIQKVRRGLNRSLKINSAHRCLFHNQYVGGAINSQHKKIALDLSVRGFSVPDRFALLKECKSAGFGTFGIYGSFLHTDPRYGRRWITKSGEKQWGLTRSQIWSV